MERSRRSGRQSDWLNRGAAQSSVQLSAAPRARSLATDGSEGKEIQATVAGAEVTRVGEGLVVTFASGLLFDVDSSSLRPNRKESRQSCVEPERFGDSKLLLVGHTDRQGTDGYDLALSRRRADAVGAYLESRGVSAARVQTSGRGETEPVATNDSDSGRQQNRRVEAAIYASDKMKADAKALAGKP